MALKLLKREAPASDEELLEGVRNREERAITLLYRRYARYVASVAYRLLGADDEVDDVVQSVFLELIRSADRVYGPEYLRSFLLRITTRQVSRRLTRRWRSRRIRGALELLLPDRSDPRDRIVPDELHEALGKLSPDLRLPWMLHHIEGQTLPETATACGVSLASVKRRIARAEKFVRGRLWK